MHHVVLDRWSHGTSAFHRTDPSAKTVALLALLIALATARHSIAILSLLYGALIVAMLAVSRVPLVAALKRAAVVLPFSLAFAAFSLAAGEPLLAAALVTKSYLSALAVLLLVSTTPVPELLRGLERMAVPRYLLLVVQFLYRYLFVISEEAQHMRAAALAKSGSLRHLLWSESRFSAAGGALGVLFARSYGHAGGIHQAMLARGFQGHFRTLSARAFRAGDAGFIVAALAVVVACRVAVEVWV